jgi:large subunit ribosomal protein L24
MSNRTGAMRFKAGDQVIVVAGNDKGAKGTILEVQRSADRVVVEGVNKRTKHKKPTQAEPKGERIERESPIHASNVMFLDVTSGKASRKRPATT